MLGQVLEINRDDIAISLPNNLTGYVPLTFISDQVNEELQRIADQDGDDDERRGNEEQNQLDLTAMFTIGQVPSRKCSLDWRGAHNWCARQKTH